MNPNEIIDFEKHAKLEAEYQACFSRWLKLHTTIERWELQRNHFVLDDSRKARLQSYKAKVEEAQKLLDAAHARRMEHGNSSLAPLLTSMEQQEAKAQELQKLANELNLKLLEATALRKEAENKSVPSAERIVSNDETLPSSSKRRRTSSGYEDSVSATLAQTKEVIKGLHATLNKVLERVSTVENSIAMQEIEVREVLGAYRSQQDEAGEFSATNPFEARFTKIQDQMESIATNINELSEWIVEIYSDHERISDEHERIIAKKNEEEADIRALLLRVDDHEKKRVKDKNEIEALSAALTAYCEKPVSPPSSPFDPETIVLNMEEQIKELVRNAIKPHVEETRATLTENLQTYDSELYRSLWSKLSMTNKVIAAVSKVTSGPPT